MRPAALHASYNRLIAGQPCSLQIGAAVMAGKYAFLLRHLSRYSTRLAAMDDVQLTALLKSRLAPVKGC
jgi:hypothetical protein